VRSGPVLMARHGVPRRLAPARAGREQRSDNSGWVTRPRAQRAAEFESCGSYRHR
jgi:hypothetical protein